MVKLTPSQRLDLRNDVKEMRATEATTSEILKTLGSKYGIRPGSVRWYLKPPSQPKAHTAEKPRNAPAENGESGKPASRLEPPHKKEKRALRNRLHPALAKSKNRAIRELLGKFSGPELRAFADARDLIEKSEVHVARARRLAQKIMDCRMSLRLTYRDIRVGHSLLRKKQRDREMQQRRLARLAEQLKNENASALAVRKEARNRFWNVQAAG